MVDGINMSSIGIDTYVLRQMLMFLILELVPLFNVGESH